MCVFWMHSLIYMLIVNLIWEVLTKKEVLKTDSTGNWELWHFAKKTNGLGWPLPPVHPEVCYCRTAGQKKSLYWVRLYGNRDMCSAEVCPQLHHCDLGVCVVMWVQSMFHWSNTKKPGRTDTDVTISTLYFCQTFFFLA